MRDKCGRQMEGKRRAIPGEGLRGTLGGKTDELRPYKDNRTERAEVSRSHEEPNERMNGFAGDSVSTSGSNGRSQEPSTEAW